MDGRNDIMVLEWLMKQSSTNKEYAIHKLL